MENNSDTKTEVDHGSDLIEVTQQNSTSEQDTLTQIEVDELSEAMRNAEILIGEDLLEEAKKVLRSILRKDIRHVPARRALERIHELELKQIFGELDFRENQKTEVIETEAIIEKLDADLGLGTSLSEMSLFQDKEQLGVFEENLEKDLRGLTGKDRMDLGIGFMEMGLYSLAIRQFKAASRLTEGQENLAASSLLAYSMILNQQSLEAILIIESILVDPDLKPEDRTEFFYLMGRAYEEMERFQDACGWYQQAITVERGYRDALERYRTVQKKCSS